ncbi:MAG: hypothetical protein IKZ53_04815 [Selenomonadaceae bacterium]|nr:hypothetical protein [Selenomonadaceae bacterium]
MKTDNFFLRIARIICFVICICLPCVSNAQAGFTANWWDNNRLTAKGFGLPPEKFIDNPYQAKLMARRAALMDAYRLLAEQAKEIHITATKTIGSEIEAGSIKKGKIDAVIKGAELLSVEYGEDNTCTVIVSVPIYGVKDSLSKVVFKPEGKKNFPLPNRYKISTGNYTGLIIDCGDSDLKPVLSPVIRNENNQFVYSYSNLDYEKVLSRGMVGYVKKESVANNPLLIPNKTGKYMPLSYTKIIENKLLLVTSANVNNNASRAGNNPLIIKATGMSDDNSCPIISAEDSDRILAENQISHFLDDGAVIFTGYRVGGVRA